MTMLAQFAAAAGGVLPAYIEDVFSTYLYTGNGSTQTITNGIDLAGEGGMVWIKTRNAIESHVVVDSVRGPTKALRTNATAAQIDNAGRVSAFTASGFTVGTDGETNGSGTTYASWTFREQPKFFDVVTYTGDGVNLRNIPHNLGSVPGCIIVKRTDTADIWAVYHRSLPANNNLILNTDQGALGLGAIKTPTATTFTVNTATYVNEAGGAYVAYIYAHDAGGFGLSGSENVVSCGSFTTSGTGDPNATVNLGYEPQWVMLKKTNGTGNWIMYDTMRGLPAAGATSYALYANLTNSEGGNNAVKLTSVGFNADTGTDAETYIYIAIRRGPMKVPTLGTTVFAPVAVTPSGSQSTVTTNFPTDLIITTERSHALTGQTFVSDRLRGTTTASRVYLATNNTNAEQVGGSTGFGLDSNVAIFDNFYPGAGITNPVIYWNFRRAPSFFDEVCYTGNGSTQTIAHNLTVVPQLIIGKNRTVAGNNWSVNFNFAPTTQSYAFLNQTVAGGNDIYANVGVFSASPTSTSMFLTNSGSMNASGSNIVAYLFATAPGVSKVGSYTGTGTTQAINCGFTAGARFVLIKRTDSTGDWYVWDSARGIVAGNDPYLLWNNGAPEVTGTDYVDASATGFELTSTAPAAINASGGSYIFLAVA